jgi:type II secretory pathway component GspD/PulD (secretin)
MMVVLLPLRFAFAADPPQGKQAEAAGIQVSVVARFVSLTPALLRNQKLEVGELFTVKKTGEKIHGRFLDDEDVNKIIRATQASEQSTVLTAPRATLRDGEKGSIAVAQQQAYVSGWTEPAAGEKRKAKISTAQTGVFLDITPHVSADRKYITLAINSRVSQLMQLKSGIWDKAPQENLKVQQPIMQEAQVETVISIPDDGTIALIVDRKDNLKENRDTIVLLLISPTIIGAGTQ